MKYWNLCAKSFIQDHELMWGALSRTTNLIAALNVSLFIVTGAVKSGGYYYPIISLTLLAAVITLLLMPLGLHRNLKFYLLCLALFLTASMFLLLSIGHWINSGEMPPMTNS